MPHGKMRDLGVDYLIILHVLTQTARKKILKASTTFEFVTVWQFNEMPFGARLSQSSGEYLQQLGVPMVDKKGPDPRLTG